MAGFSRVSSLVVLSLATSLASCQRPVKETPEMIRMLGGWAISSVFLAEYQKALPGVKISMDANRSTEFVVSALEEGRAEVGFAQADAVYLAYRTSLVDNASRRTQLRGIAVSDSSNVYLIVRRDSPYRRITDLKNRRIGVFTSGTHAAYTRMILAAYGLNERVADFKAYRPDEMAAHVQDRTIDAATFGGPGIPEVMMQLNQSVGIRLLELGGDVITQLRGRYPFLNPVVVTAEDLPGQERDVQTLGVDRLLVCRQDLSDARVYELTRAFFEASNKATSGLVTPPVVDPDRAAATPIPLHPGAARYYREREVLQ